MVKTRQKPGPPEKTIAILHWLPAEMYPPLINMVRHLAASGTWKVVLFTIENHHDRPAFAHDGVTVHRSPSPGPVRGWRRLVAYASFHVSSFFRLLFSRPDAIVYIEPRSAFPVFLLSFLRRRFPLFIHHHEYHEPREFFRPGMRLPRWFHRLEQWRLFKRVDWVSHTNEERLKLFLADNPTLHPELGRLLPNYPPRSWSDGSPAAWENGTARPLRMVYVGSLSIRDTYISEFVDWVRRQPPGTVAFDIFAYNTDRETKEFLEQCADGGIRFFPEGIEYDALPRILRTYHTGMLLYRADNLNYQFNASNKLFEYLACGLDVIFPGKMLGVKPYARTAQVPRVLEANFETGEGLDLTVLSNRGPLPDAPRPPAAEDALAVFEQALIAAVGGRQND